MNEAQKAQVIFNQSLDYYLTIFDLAPSSYLVLNEDGIILGSNLAAANLFRIERSKFINRPLAQFIAGDSQKKLWNEQLLLVKQGEINQRFELTFPRFSDVALFVQVNLTTVDTSDCVRHLLITLNDISHLKRTNQHSHLAAMAFQTGVGIIITDENKSILQVNEALTRITGYSQKEIIKNPPYFLRKDGQEATIYQTCWLSVANAGYWQGKIKDRRKGNEYYSVWLTVTTVKGEDSISRYVCSFTEIIPQNITEQKLPNAQRHLEQQIASMKDELEKVKKETIDSNTAISVLLKHQEGIKTQQRQALSNEVDETILPFLKKLKSVINDRQQSSHLIDTLEANLQLLVTNYGHSDRLPTTLHQLTPLETQVAAMVRQGLPSKAIAKTLNITEGTVSIHRNHIRKKLGLKSKGDNLQMHLKKLLN